MAKRKIEKSSAFPGKTERNIDRGAKSERQIPSLLLKKRNGEV